MGSNFEGTPISQLFNSNTNTNTNNNNYNEQNNNFGSMPQITPPVYQPNNLFNQPSNDIRNLVQNINSRLDDNTTFDMSNQSNNSGKNQFIKYYNKNDDIDTESSSDKRLKKILKKKKKIEKLKRLQKKKEKSEDTDTDTDKESDYIAFYNVGKHLSKDTKELLLIFVIYIFLSLGFIKRFVGNYISQMNPDETGKYSFISIIIYGLLLGILFITLRKLVLERK